MKKHEDTTVRKARKRARLVLGVTALVSAAALAAPTIAGAGTKSVLITQNTSMIVNVSPTADAGTTATVSWSDVSWGDVSWSDAVD